MCSDSALDLFEQQLRHADDTVCVSTQYHSSETDNDLLIAVDEAQVSTLCLLDL